MIKGITVKIYKKTLSGTDGFNRPVYTETAEYVDNVLVAPLSETEITDMMTLYGARAVYQLGIPKGDTHDWNDCRVEFFGRTFHTVGDVLEGIEEMIPLSWNRKVRVELISG